MPRPYADGLLIVGLGRLFERHAPQGHYLGMKSGMLAAETLWEALQADAFDRGTLASYERRFKESWRTPSFARRATSPRIP